MYLKIFSGETAWCLRSSSKYSNKIKKCEYVCGGGGDRKNNYGKMLMVVEAEWEVHWKIVGVFSSWLLSRFGNFTEKVKKNPAPNKEGYLKSTKNGLHNNTDFCGKIQGICAKTQEQ